MPYLRSNIPSKMFYSPYMDLTSEEPRGQLVPSLFNDDVIVVVWFYSIRDLFDAT